MAVKNYGKGFTLSELLVSLAILGLIAIFTIPKILIVQQNQRYNSEAKEAIATVSGAFQELQQFQTITSNTAPDDLTTYMNYVNVDTTSTIDLFQTASTRACNSGYSCVRLHNGGMLLWATGGYFGGTATTNAIYFYFDPDGQVTDGTTNGPGKSLVIWLYANGRITTYGGVIPGTINGSSGAVTANSAYDPPWYSL